MEFSLYFLQQQAIYYYKKVEMKEQKNYFIGIDLGSSFIKLVIIDEEQNVITHLRMPEQQQMKIQSRQIGWAQQDPMSWWNYTLLGLQKMLLSSKINPNFIQGIGISYQMHGLVMVNKQGQVIAPANIWCDSRATQIGQHLNELMIKHGLNNKLLNHPSNFTLSKLFWLKKNQPQIYEKAFKIMLPGDFIAYKMTGCLQTTIQGLSEAVLWDYASNSLSKEFLDILQVPSSLIPDIVCNFSLQCATSEYFNTKFGLQKPIPIYYRSGDQPNNAFSLNIINPGQVAATAGTSGVIFSISDCIEVKQNLKINSFLHVNHQKYAPRIGKLLCINSCGSIYQWIRKNMFQNLTYDEMNQLADQNQSEGLIVIPFGNGSQRMMNNKDIHCHILNIIFGKHQKGNIIRAVVEGIAFSFIYGAKIMERDGTKISVIRAGKSNLFECGVLCQIISTVLGVQIEIMDTNGSEGAAKGSLLGYLKRQNQKHGLIETNFQLKVEKVKSFSPEREKEGKYKRLYLQWENELQKLQKKNLSLKIITYFLHHINLQQESYKKQSEHVNGKIRLVRGHGFIMGLKQISLANILNLKDPFQDVEAQLRIYLSNMLSILQSKYDKNFNIIYKLVQQKQYNQELSQSFIYLFDIEKQILLSYLERLFYIRFLMISYNIELGSAINPCLMSSTNYQFMKKYYMLFLPPFWQSIISFIFYLLRSGITIRNWNPSYLAKCFLKSTWIFNSYCLFYSKISNFSIQPKSLRLIGGNVNFVIMYLIFYLMKSMRSQKSYVFESQRTCLIMIVLAFPGCLSLKADKKIRSIYSRDYGQIYKAL